MKFIRSFVRFEDFGPAEFDSLAFLAFSRTHAYVWFDILSLYKVSNKIISGKKKKYVDT